jgi:hypothetical protein
MEGADRALRDGGASISALKALHMDTALCRRPVLDVGPPFRRRWSRPSSHPGKRGTYPGARLPGATHTTLGGGSRASGRSLGSGSFEWHCAIARLRFQAMAGAGTTYCSPVEWAVGGDQGSCAAHAGGRSKPKSLVGSLSCVTKERKPNQFPDSTPHSSSVLFCGDGREHPFPGGERMRRELNAALR